MAEKRADRRRRRRDAPRVSSDRRRRPRVARVPERSRRAPALAAFAAAPPSAALFQLLGPRPSGFRRSERSDDAREGRAGRGRAPEIRRRGWPPGEPDAVVLRAASGAGLSRDHRIARRVNAASSRPTRAQDFYPEARELLIGRYGVKGMIKCLVTEFPAALRGQRDANDPCYYKVFVEQGRKRSPGRVPFTVTCSSE